MIVIAKIIHWLKFFNASAIKPILIVLFALLSHAAVAEYTVTLSKIADSLDGHSTTRTTVRRVFHHDGYWYVFCGDRRNDSYCNFFATSTDGINWSARKVGTGGGITGDEYGATNHPETAIVYGNQIYGCYSEKSELFIRSGTLTDGDIVWKNGNILAPTYVDKSTRNFFGYYPDIMIEEDGYISISLRHYQQSETNSKLNPTFVISTKPYDISSWQKPQDLITFTSTEKSDAHENVPLPGGKRVVITRSTKGESDKELYKPGHPGNFYAFHYDGVKWLEPVDLGDSDGIAGSDKRLSAMLDPGTGIVHLTYIEDSGTVLNNELHYRTLNPPYGVDDWSSPTTIDSNVFTVTLGMDTSSVPARIAAVYGEQFHEGGEVEPTWGSRWHTGRLYLRWFDGTDWESGRQLISEQNDEYAWFPSIQQDVLESFGVLYMKGGFTNFRKTQKELMFALIEPDN